jgi:hypothetical protein
MKQTVTVEELTQTAAELLNQILLFNQTPELIEKRKEMFGEFRPARKT